MAIDNIARGLAAKALSEAQGGGGSGTTLYTYTMVINVDDGQDSANLYYQMTSTQNIGTEGHTSITFDELIELLPNASIMLDINGVSGGNFADVGVDKQLKTITVGGWTAFDENSAYIVKFYKNTIQ